MVIDMTGVRGKANFAAGGRAPSTCWWAHLKRMQDEHHRQEMAEKP
jgi:hypothetical protein